MTSVPSAIISLLVNTVAFIFITTDYVLVNLMIALFNLLFAVLLCELLFNFKTDYERRQILPVAQVVAQINPQAQAAPAHGFVAAAFLLSTNARARG